MADADAVANAAWAWFVAEAQSAPAGGSVGALTDESTGALTNYSPRAAGAPASRDCGRRSKFVLESCR